MLPARRGGSTGRIGEERREVRREASEDRAHITRVYRARVPREAQEQRVTKWETWETLNTLPRYLSEEGMKVKRA